MRAFCWSLGCRTTIVGSAKTLEEMKYQVRLEKTWRRPRPKSILEKELIYVRPPKGLSGPTKTFTLAVVEPGRFDLENSFIDESKAASLHVLARHKKPKAPPKKGATPPPAAAPRGDFTAEVIDLVKDRLWSRRPHALEVQVGHQETCGP